MWIFTVASAVIPAGGEIELGVLISIWQAPVTGDRCGIVRSIDFRIAALLLMRYRSAPQAVIYKTRPQHYPNSTCLRAQRDVLPETATVTVHPKNAPLKMMRRRQ